jgi:hypothetical protein
MHVDVALIQQILDEEDVEGLLQLGARLDEYASEARMIADALLEQTPGPAVEEDAVARLVTDVCNRMFGPFDEEQLAKRRSVYERIARKIVAESQATPQGGD